MLKLSDKIVYKADTETNDGISETEYKCNKHTKSHGTHENGLELSKFI